MTVRSITQVLGIGLPTVVHEGLPVTSFGDWWQHGKTQQERTLNRIADIFALARPLATRGVRVCLDLAHVRVKEGSLDPVLGLSVPFSHWSAKFTSVTVQQGMTFIYL